MQRNTIVSVFGVLTLLILITAAIFFYAQGYRLDLSRGTLTTSGMILARSQPEGARVLIDGKLAAATNSTISGLTPGVYHLRIEKDGYLPWEKNIEVKAELITDINALLPPRSPSLTAITQEGASLVTPAPSGTKAAFVSGKKLYLLPLTNQFLGFLRINPQELGQLGSDFPQPTELLFSPKEDQVLVASPEKTLLFTLGQPNPQPISDQAALKTAWKTEILTQRSEAAKRLNIPEELKEAALSSKTVWSPDEKKILYVKGLPTDRQEFWVANFVTPLPVGEQTNRKIWETENPNLRLFWLADSHHLIILENDTISLLDLDGTNKLDLFKGTLAEAVALSSSDLSQIIILTSISPNSPANLYGISLR